MSPYQWVGGQSGDYFSTPNNWSPSGVPGSADTAIIAASGSYVVTIDSSQSVHAVTLDSANATLSVLSGSALDLTGSNAALTVSAGSFDLAGDLNGGTVTAAGGVLEFETSATLDGVTWQGTLTFRANEGLFVTGGLLLESAAGSSPGSIDLSAGNDQLHVLDSETLNHAILNFGALGGNYLFFNDLGGGTATTLTLGSGFTIDQTGGNSELYDANTLGTIGNAGLIAVSGGVLYGYQGNFANSGTLSASGGGTIDLSATTLDNTGTITIGANSEVVLGSSGDAAGITFNGTGATLMLDAPTGYTGTIDGMQAGDSIALPSLAYDAAGSANLLAGNLLKIVKSSTTLTLHLDPLQNFSGDYFHLFQPASGGSAVIESTRPCYLAGTRIATDRGDARAGGRAAHSRAAGVARRGARGAAGPGHRRRLSACRSRRRQSGSAGPYRRAAGAGLAGSVRRGAWSGRCRGRCRPHRAGGGMLSHAGGRLGRGGAAAAARRL